jgi:Polymerase beta, Nucleotidyltransferase
VRDLDVALYTTEDKDFLFAIDVAALLRRDTGFEADVTVMNHAPVALQFAILRDGLLLFSKDEARRMALIERVSRQYREYTHFRDLFLGVAGARSQQDR